MGIPAYTATDEHEVISAINTTPLVDIMLVLLIIFLITVPVVIKTVPVRLPQEANLPTVTRPDNVHIAIDRHGGIFWNEQAMTDKSRLLPRLQQLATLPRQPEVHIRGDKETDYEFVGSVVHACQRAGLRKVVFILEPPLRGG